MACILQNTEPTKPLELGFSGELFQKLLGYQCIRRPQGVWRWKSSGITNARTRAETAQLTLLPRDSNILSSSNLQIVSRIDKSKEVYQSHTVSGALPPVHLLFNQGCLRKGCRDFISTVFQQESSIYHTPEPSSVHRKKKKQIPTPNRKETPRARSPLNVPSSWQQKPRVCARGGP